jgi:hypothetical protein
VCCVFFIVYKPQSESKPKKAEIIERVATTERAQQASKQARCTLKKKCFDALFTSAVSAVAAAAAAAAAAESTAKAAAITTNYHKHCNF